MVSASWISPSGEEINTSGRFSVSPITVESSQLHRSTLKITQLDPALDSGLYRCNASIDPLTDYVFGSSTVASTTISVNGELPFPLLQV